MTDVELTLLRLLMVGLPLVFARLIAKRLLFPYRRPQGLSDRDLDDLVRWKKRLDWKIGWFAFAIAAVTTGGIWYGLASAEEARNDAMPAHLYVLPAFGGSLKKMLWGLPALVLGAVVWGTAHAVLVRVALNQRDVAAYQVAANAPEGVNHIRLGRVTAVVVVSLTLIGLVLVFDWYTRVEEDKVVVNELWGLGERGHAYFEIEKLVVTTHTPEISLRGSRITGERSYPRLWVVFQDGSRLVIAHPSGKTALVDHLTRKAGKIPITVRLPEQVFD
jgi:hypothetical protein